jgi:hypothetical protein
LKEEGGGSCCGGGRGWLLGSTAKGTVLGGGAGEEIEDGSMRRERKIFEKWEMKWIIVNKDDIRLFRERECENVFFFFYYMKEEEIDDRRVRWKCEISVRCVWWKPLQE